MYGSPTYLRGRKFAASVTANIPQSFMIEATIDCSLLWSTRWPFPGSAAEDRFAPYLSSFYLSCQRTGLLWGAIKGQGCPTYADTGSDIIHIESGRESRKLEFRLVQDSKAHLSYSVLWNWPSTLEARDRARSLSISIVIAFVTDLSIEPSSYIPAWVTSWVHKKEESACCACVVTSWKLDVKWFQAWHMTQSISDVARVLSCADESVPRCRETLQGHKDVHSSMRPENHQQFFCHALISKCPNPPRFQPNPHLK